MWPPLDPSWPHMTFDPSNVLLLGQGFFLPNLVTVGHSWVFWPLVDPGWPLHDLRPQHCTTLWSGVLPTKFGGHRSFLNNLMPSWPRLTHHDLWPYQCTTLRSGVLPTKFGSHRAFLSNLTPGWPRLTPAWPLTPAKHCTSVRGSFYQIWWP